MKTMLFLLVATMTFTGLSTNLMAEELQTITWSDLLRDSNQPRDGKLLSAESPRKGKVLKIENAEDTPKQVRLLEIKDPQITESTYAICGDVRYEYVKGKSYLEMWNYFPDGSYYFSRTLADQGLLRHLQGTSDWRPFSLPFHMDKQNTSRPNRLVVNLVLEGSGTVYLSPLHFDQYTSPQQALKVSNAWWRSQTGGLIGGIFGGLFGGLSGLLGSLANRGRARRFVMVLMLVITSVGVLLIVLGIVALLCSQPYEVWFPLLLIGVITTTVFVPLRTIFRRRYETWELRRISAIDLGMAPEGPFGVR